MIDELPQYENIKPKFLAVWFSRMLDFFIPHTADHIIAISKNLKAFLTGKKINPKDITVVPLEFSMDCFNHKTVLDISTQYNLPQGPRIIYTGTLDKFQRLDYLLSIFKKVSTALPQTSLVVVANQYKPHQLAEFKTICEAYGLSQSITVITDSVLSDLLSLISACDVAVIPRPDCPGFPMKILNYMASGSAIVCFKKSANTLVHKETALIATDHDRLEFSNHIIYLIENTELRCQLGKNARKTFETMERYDTVSRIIRIYKKLLSKG